GRSGSPFQPGRSIHEAGCRRPRYSTGGAGAGAAGVAGGGHTAFSTGGQTSGSGATATGGGSVVHPAARSSNPAAHERAIEDNAHAPVGARERRLGWVFLEIAVALVIAV